MHSSLLSRRSFVTGVTGGLLAAGTAPRLPNFVVIYCDDLGYGDLGCYGSPIRTPNLDRMATEGVKFTSCLTANPICSPSRAGLLTARYPTRVGVPRVFFPKDKDGLNLDEQTLPQQLKGAGYSTACVGKWHLGRPDEYLPTSRGFDSYYGIPYSNDMKPAVMLRNKEIVEPETDQTTLTPRYTGESLKFITAAKDKPFLLYLAPNYPHIPLHASPRFKGKSSLGLYGDVIEELDWSVGEVLNHLRRSHLERNTLVLFASDNGPWFQGSPGRLRGRKGFSTEGGVRVPFLAWWPGKVPAGKTSNTLVSTLDFMPTLLGLAGAAQPAKKMDGVDIWPILSGQKPEVSREVFLYFDDWNLQCARLGKWKLHIARYNTPPYVAAPPGGRWNLPLAQPELYNMDLDLDESYDVAPEHPDVVRDILARMEAAVLTFPDPVQKDWAETKKRDAVSIGTGAHPYHGKLPARP